MDILKGVPSDLPQCLYLYSQCGQGSLLCSVAGAALVLPGTRQAAGAGQGAVKCQNTGDLEEVSLYSMKDV